MPVKFNENWFKNRLKMELRRWGVTDVKALKEFIDKVPTDVAFEMAQEEADRLAKMVVDEIESQPFWWKPLNPEYKASKIRKGLSEEMLKATEEYIQSIGVQEATKGKTGYKIRVGVPNKKHSESDVNLNDLAMIHELGTSKIPARPHWYPVYRRWKNSIPFMVQRLQRKVSKELEAELRKISLPQSRAKKVKGD